MLYKSNYNEIILKQLLYDSKDDSFYFMSGDSYKKFENKKHKIFLCLEKKCLSRSRYGSGLTAIKLLIDNQIGWDLENHYEKI